MLKKYDEHDSVQDKQMFLKRAILWYGMLCYAILCYGMESMVCYDISMLCYEISMLCYAVVYVVKDKHSATVIPSPNLSDEYKDINKVFVYDTNRIEKKTGNCVFKFLL